MDILNTIGKFLKVAVEVFKAISKAGPRILQVLLVFSVVLFGTSIALYHYQYNTIQTAFERLLAAPPLPVTGSSPNDPLSFPALEAVLTSHLDAQTVVEHQRLLIAPTLTRIYDNIRSAIADRKDSEAYPLTFHLRKKDREPTKLDYFITDESRASVLFVPLVALRPIDMNATTNLREHLATNHPSIIADLQLARQIEPILTGLSQYTGKELLTLPAGGAEVFDERPVNIYVVFQSGVTRMVTRDDAARRYYLSQFRPTTFFPSRPYFWPAVESLRLRNSHDFTGSYFDLAGKGLVFTVTQAFEYGDGNYLCLCIDFGLSDKGTRSIKDHLASFDTKVRSVGIRKDNTSNELNPDEIEDLNLSSTEKDELAKFADPDKGEYLSGGIRVLSRSGDSLLFTIPVRGSRAEIQPLLVGRMDLRRLRLVKTMLTAAPIIFGVLTIFVIYAILSILRKGRDYQQAVARNYDKILTIDPFDEEYARLAKSERIEDWPAYCRLDHEDRIVSCSEAFLKLLRTSIDENGGRSAARENLRKITFQSLMYGKESRETYEKIQSQRQDGKDLNADEPVPYYVVNLCWPRKENWVRCRIYSARLPEPENRSVGIPETFGLVFKLAEGVVSKDVER